MIKINKAPIAEAPDIITGRGKRRTKKDCDLFDASPNEYLSPNPRVRMVLKVMEDIYQDSDVKEKLNESHYLKCCYCESKFTYPRDLDIEHFRPKKYSQQSENSIEILLVYFWLVYDWDNLLLSCAECNRGYKKNLFPLKKGSQRATPQNRDISNESPIFINPALASEDDPRKHIEFDNETPKGITPRGKKIIDLLGLRRDELFEARLEHLKEIKKQLKIIRKWEKLLKLNQRIDDSEIRELLEEAREEGIEAILFLENAIKPEAEFSSMTQDFLAQQPFSNPET